MTMSPTAIRTARRNAVARVARFLDKAKGGPPLSPAVLANLGLAIERIEIADYRESEDAMMLAEDGRAPRLVGPAKQRSLAELIEEFGRIQRGE